jgi:hypothetical protein
MRLVAGVLGVGIALAMCASTGTAAAFEREWHLGGAVGVADGSGLSLSPALGVYAAYGLSDVFDARLEVTARGYHFGSDTNPQALAAAAGLVYKLDVLRWIPWAGVYAGYLGFFDQPRADLTFQQHDALIGFGAGLDYAVTRNFGLGASFRFDVPLSHTDVDVLDVLLRAEYRWGW